jgi:hypothetical protein
MDGYVAKIDASLKQNLAYGTGVHIERYPRVWLVRMPPTSLRRILRGPPARERRRRMKSNTRIHHQYTLYVNNLSAYGKAAAIVEALAPLTSEANYGYIDKFEEVTIWWETIENLG